MLKEKSYQPTNSKLENISEKLPRVQHRGKKKQLKNIHIYKKRESETRIEL